MIKNKNPCESIQKDKHVVKKEKKTSNNNHRG